MNALLTVQVVCQRRSSDQALRTLCAPVLSALDSLSDALCGKKGMAVFYQPGQLVDAAEGCPAMRWVLVVSLGKQRIDSLQGFLEVLMPLLSNQLVDCTLQWKLESLEFLP